MPKKRKKPINTSAKSKVKLLRSVTVRLDSVSGQYYLLVGTRKFGDAYGGVYYWGTKAQANSAAASMRKSARIRKTVKRK